MHARLTFLCVLTLAIVFPSIQWWISVDPFATIARWEMMPAGQGYYLLAKLLGMLSVSLAIVQLMMSGLIRLGFDGFARRDHRALGLLTALLIIGHIAAFITAASLRGEGIALHLLVPNLTHGTYNRGVSLGAFGFWLLLVGLAIPLLRFRARVLHRLVILAVAMGLGHGLWIGTEKTYVIAMCATAGIVLVLTALSQMVSVRRGSA